MPTKLPFRVNRRLSKLVKQDFDRVAANSINCNVVPTKALQESLQAMDPDKRAEVERSHMHEMSMEHLRRSAKIMELERKTVVARFKQENGYELGFFERLSLARNQRKLELLMQGDPAKREPTFTDSFNAVKNRAELRGRDVNNIKKDYVRQPENARRALGGLENYVETSLALIEGSERTAIQRLTASGTLNMNRYLDRIGYRPPEAAQPQQAEVQQAQPQQAEAPQAQPQQGEAQAAAPEARFAESGARTAPAPEKTRVAPERLNLHKTADRAPRAAESGSPQATAERKPQEIDRSDD